MTGCCNYMGLCVNCVNSGSYWFTLNTTETVQTCCCHDPHNQPGTIIDWAEYPTQCKPEDTSTQSWMIFGFSALVFVLIFLVMILVYIYKKGFVQRWIHRRGGRRGSDGLPLIRYNFVYDTEMTTLL